MRSFVAMAAAAALLIAGSGVRQPPEAAELIMIEEAGCPWCAAWDEAIAPIYPKTAEGRRAPLRRVDMHRPLPEDLDFLVKGHVTPTFVVVDEGKEIGRIRGYPGEDFFWALLGELLGELEAGESASPAPRQPGIPTR